MEPQKNKDVYYCGPQRWPRWIRKILSRYYNRPCRNHDENYDNPDCDFEESEAQFKDEVSRRRKVLRKAWKLKKVPLLDYIIHALIFGYVFYRFTRLIGRRYKNE